MAAQVNAAVGCLARIPLPHAALRPLRVKRGGTRASAVEGAALLLLPSASCISVAHALPKRHFELDVGAERAVAACDLFLWFDVVVAYRDRSGFLL